MKQYSLPFTTGRSEFMSPLEPKRKVYIAGHIMSKGARYQRAEEAEMVSNLGHEVFNPKDAEHNDKAASVSNDLLCDVIVENDKAAFKWADTVLIEPLPEALGTHVELGTLHGMREVAKEVLELIQANRELDDGAVIHLVKNAMKTHVDRKVYPHYSDLRRVDGITETGDLRSLGINQYVYGVCRDLTDGKGFYEMNEIEEALK